MTKVVLKPIQRSKAVAKSVQKRRLRKSNGESAPVRSIDANDDNFLDALTVVFEQNVAKARRENKKLFGSPDGIAKK
jgi:hypothetical protein